MPRKPIIRTPQGAIVEGKIFIVRVAYHTDQNFATTDADLVGEMGRVFERHGWKHIVEEFDLHSLPASSSLLDVAGRLEKLNGR